MCGDCIVTRHTYALIRASRCQKLTGPANRRVSFAPEATLHTWDVVELPEDSTTSSASTNATRRASALSAAATSPYPQPQSQELSSDASEPPSTPPEQIEETVIAQSPAHQRDLHQKKRRRSSGIPPMNFNNPDDFSSSPSGDSVTSEDARAQKLAPVEDGSDSIDSDDNDLVEGDGIEAETDGDDSTSHSVLSALSSGDSSTGSSGRLDAALRQAAMQAGTQGIDFDENGDLTMELADDEVTAAFKPWMKNGKYTPKILGDPSALLDQENLNPFSPAFKANTMSQVSTNEDGQTMDFTQAVGGISPAKPVSQGSPANGRRQSPRRQGIIANHGLSNDGVTLGDETMELTKAIGGIQSALQTSTNATAANRRRSGAAVYRISEDGSRLEDATMDLTTAIGGIQSMISKPGQATDAASSVSEAEELSMEFTSVVGGGIVGICDEARESRQKFIANDTSANQPGLRGYARRSSGFSTVDEEDMDITIAVGGILPDITEYTEPLEDQTAEMDITAAMGGILPQSLTTDDKSQAKLMMERETDAGQLSGLSAQDTAAAAETPKSTRIVGRNVADRMSTMASETGSPSLSASQSRASSRRSIGSRLSTTPKQAVRQTTPNKKPLTPSKQLTPQPLRPTTPGKTPPIKNVAMRTGSPKKLFKSEIKHAALTPQAAPTTAFFQQDTISGIPTPSIVLKPRRRRSSGLGIDKEGLGSPHIATLLDRRTSIGDSAQVFTPQGQAATGVRFDNPRIMVQQLEQERAEEARRESGRGILEMEADEQDLEDEKDVTTMLKERIGSLTPQKKRKLNRRKSLHVGAAKGILGKRPAELDEDEDEDEDNTPKRLKGREGSPVKNIRLPAPTSKNETSGRITRSTRASLGNSTGNAQISTPKKSLSPQKSNRITTPNEQNRFKDSQRQISAAKLASFDEKANERVPTKDDPIDESEDRIHLQDFLNLTSIRFMELTTTKRRHTTAPNPMLEGSAKKANLGAQDTAEAGAERQLKDCVVAGACTVPMLELYQHVRFRP